MRQQPPMTELVAQIVAVVIRIAVSFNRCRS